MSVTKGQKKTRRLVIRYRKAEPEPNEPIERTMQEQAESVLAALPGHRPTLRVQPASRKGVPDGVYDAYGNWRPRYTVIDGEHAGKTGTRSELAQLGDVRIVGGRHASHREVGKAR